MKLSERCGMSGEAVAKKCIFCQIISTGGDVDGTILHQVRIIYRIISFVSYIFTYFLIGDFEYRTKRL